MTLFYADAIQEMFLWMFNFKRETLMAGKRELERVQERVRVRAHACVW